MKLKNAKYIVGQAKYANVDGIEKKPKLFAKIYVAWCEYNGYQVREVYPMQDLAYLVLNDAKKGLEYAQFLKLPENEIITVCRHEKISKTTLAKMLNIPVSRLDNCVSRGKCSKPVKALLRERFNYIGE